MDMLTALADANRRIVGARQVLRAIAAGDVSGVFIARDADPFLTRPVMDACEKAHIRFDETQTMADLGRACGIAVKASVAALRK
jgi:large subunit ribosomal protein L7A